MLHMKQFKEIENMFSRFDRILVIWPIAEMYGESNERQLCYRRLGKWMKWNKVKCYLEEDTAFVAHVKG